MKTFSIFVFIAFLALSCGSDGRKSRFEKPFFTIIFEGLGNNEEVIVNNKLEVIFYDKLPKKDFSKSVYGGGISNVRGFHEVVNFENKSKIYISQLVLDDNSYLPEVFYHEYGHFVENIIFSNLGVKRSLAFNECFAQSFAYMCLTGKYEDACKAGIEYCEEHDLEVTSDEASKVARFMYFLEIEKDIIKNARKHFNDFEKLL